MHHSRFKAALAGAVLLVGATPAFAVGTAAGTDISNQATVNYSVSSVSQDPVNSNVVTFKADRRINLTVAEVGGAAMVVVPNSANQVLTFTVSNTSNATLDFRLTASNDANGATTAFGGTDSFNPSAVSVFVDSNGNGSFDPGVDTATFLDEIPADATRTVFIVSTIPSTVGNGAIAGLTLTAISADSGSAGVLGSDSTQTAGADTPGTVDTVFGDGAGDTDAARDGRHSDDDEYDVVTATISVNKTSVVVSDPFNGTTNPKAIPGAVIEYCVQVSNTGSNSASNVVTSDAIPTNTTYVPGSIFAGGTVTGGSCNADGTAEDDNASGADESDPNGGNFTAGTVSTSIPSVAAGSTVASRFRVTIN